MAPVYSIRSLGGMLRFYRISARSLTSDFLLFWSDPFTDLQKHTTKTLHIYPDKINIVDYQRVSLCSTFPAATPKTRGELRKHFHINIKLGYTVVLRSWGVLVVYLPCFLLSDYLLSRYYELENLGLTLKTDRRKVPVWAFH